MAKGLSFAYDEHADVLYLSVGNPKPAVTEEVVDGVLLRRNPATGELVGVTILDFRTAFLKHPKRLPFTLRSA